MKLRKTLPTFSSGLLKIAVVACLGGFVAIPMANAEPAPAVAPAESGNVTGVVVDSEGEPLIGVTVMVKGTTTGTATDIDGQFSVMAKAGQELVFSYVGYTPKTIKVEAGRFNLGNVTLTEDSQNLSDVVVIGYGTQRKGDVTSAVASVKAEDFTAGAIGDASELVKGKIAGLTIAKGSGDPNETSTIRLRGIGSIYGGSTPLVLIDGIEGGLNTVAPENIASIDVLKDASAAAIYGTRGAQGVILITTKSGQRDEKVTVSYSGYGSWSNLANKHDFMTPAQIRQGYTTFTDRGHDTDWLDAITRTAFTQNHDFQIAGGTAKTTYMGNLSYKKAQGTIIDTWGSELKMNFDVSHWFFNDILKAHLNIVKRVHKNSAVAATGGGDGNIYLQAIMRNPTEPIFAEDGTYYENFGVNYYYNPVSMIKNLEGEYKSETTRMSGDLTVEPIKGWQTKILYSTNRTNDNNQYYYNSEYFSQKSQYFTGSGGQSHSNSQSDLLEVTSNYRATWDLKHRFDALIGYSWQKNSYSNFWASNYNFPTDYFGYNNLGAGTALVNGKAGIGSGASEDKLIGFFARVSYGFDNRYNILLSIRHEGSSKFGANHKWGNFPSVSAGWTITNEKFMEEANQYVNNLRLRAGYGVTGVVPSSPYMSLTRYAYDRYYYENGEWVKSLMVASNPNPDLKWETSREFNVGLDYGFLNNRLNGTIDFYIKNTHDLLYDYNVPTPPNLYPTTLANVGKLRNTGIEVRITGVPVQTKDWNWETTVTFSHNANKLISLSNDLYQTNSYIDAGWMGQPVSLSTQRLEEGKSIGQWYMMKSVGVSDNGLWLIENKITGEAEELTDDMLTNDDYYQYVGHALPQYYLGWSNTVRYKNWDLSAVFTGQFDFKILNEARVFYENNSIAYNRLQSVLNAPYGERTLSPTQKQTAVSYHLENGDFFKLTNLTLGYIVPLKQNKWIEQIRVYFSAENLFNITKYKGLDPELSNGDIWNPGIERRDNYPTIRSYTVGLNLTF